MTVISIGEILWDVYPDRARLGGATFNFAVNIHRLGHRSIFLSAVADDELGAVALQQAAAWGLDTSFIQLTGGAPTGQVSVRLDTSGEPDFVIHRPAAYDFLRVDAALLARVVATQCDWIYFGTL